MGKELWGGWLCEVNFHFLRYLPALNTLQDGNGFVSHHFFPKISSPYTTVVRSCFVTLPLALPWFPRRIWRVEGLVVRRHVGACPVHPLIEKY